MKRLTYFLFLLVLGLNTVQAQDDFISSSPTNDEDCFASLSGKGGVLLLSELNDLVITINNAKSPQVTPRGKRSDGLYTYEIVIDLKDNKTPKIEVNRRGEIYKTDFVVSLKPDFMKAYTIGYVKNPIRMENQTKGNDAILDQKLTEVEISSTIKNLQVSVPSALDAQVTQEVKKTDQSITITSIIIPWENIKSLKAAVEQAKKDYDAIQQVIDKKGANATDEEWNKRDALEEKWHDAENTYRSTMHIDVFADGTNREQIDLEPLGPRVKLCYGVLLLKQIEKVYVTECSALVSEGARLFGMRQYDHARRNFVNALKAKDTPTDIIPSIQGNILQCDTCLKYEQYAMGALIKMKQMRQAGVSSQKDVVRYASGAVEFMNVLNKYNPCDFYGERIEKLEKIIEDMPLDLKFTIAKWVNDFAGFYEDGTLGNVELWAYFGESTPPVKTYQSDKKFLNMVNDDADHFKQLGESDEQGIIDIHLVRKDLPKGFFFRPVGYADRVKIKYMDAREIMLQSEGEYNKRQIRLKMYTRPND